MEAGIIATGNLSVSLMAFKLSSRRSRRNLTPIQTIRLVMFGSGGVGKTSLIHRFLFDNFSANYTPTIEDDYRKVITHKNHIVDVTVLDTAGCYQFPAMRKHAIQHGHGFIIVYAVDNPQSLDECKRLYNEVTSIKGVSNCPVILVGNKIDKSPIGKRKISRDSVHQLLEDSHMNVEHIETSAQINHNVSLVFNKLIGIIDDRNIESLSTSISNISRSGNLCKSTMKLNTTSKTSLASMKISGRNKLEHAYSMDDSMDEIKNARKNTKSKRKFLRKLFTRKTTR